MRKILVLTVLFVFIAGIFPAIMQDDADSEADLSPITIPDTQAIPLTSTINGRDYLLKVALPASYSASDQSYPVLYLLDPAISFQSVTEFLRWLGHWDELPELIVVGIGYPSDDIDDMLSVREYDYVRHQDEFIDVISQEIFPLIDSTYRTGSSDRALVGFSYGGEFALHALVNRPETFNRYVVIDSETSEITRLFTGNLTDFRERLSGLDVKLFVAHAGNESAATMNETLIAALQRQNIEGLEASGLYLGNVTHAAALHLGLPAGIMAIYAE